MDFKAFFSYVRCSMAASLTSRHHSILAASLCIGWVRVVTESLIFIIFGFKLPYPTSLTWFLKKESAISPNYQNPFMKEFNIQKLSEDENENWKIRKDFHTPAAVQ